MIACGLFDVLGSSGWPFIMSGSAGYLSLLFPAIILLDLLSTDILYQSFSILLVSGFGFASVHYESKTAKNSQTEVNRANEDSDDWPESPDEDVISPQDNLPIGLFRTGIDGEIISANPKFAEMLGYKDKNDLLKHLSKEFYYDLSDRTRLIAILKEQGEVSGYEVSLKRNDGSRFWVLMNILAVRDENGRIVSLDGSIMDITERRMAQERLGRSEANLLAVLENTDNAIASFDRDGGLIVFNRVFAEIVMEAFGVELSEGFPILKHLPEELSREYRGYRNRCLNGEQFSIENEVHFPDGGVRYYEQSYSPIKQKGQITGITLIAYDITEQKKSIETLTRFRTALDNSGDAVIIIDPATMKIVDVNQIACDVLEYTREELVRMGPEEINPDFNTEKVQKDIEAIFNSGHASGIIVSRHRTKSGKDIPVEVNVTIADGDEGRLFIATARDITQRLQIEADIRERDEKYRLLFENANEAICIIQDGIMKVFNPKMVEMLHYTPEEILRTSFDKFIYKDDLAFVMDRHKRRLMGENVPETYDFRAMDKYGTVRWININAVKFSYEGRPATLCFLTDINESRLAQMALQESEELFRTLVEKMGEGVGIVDPDDNFIFVNPAAHDLFGIESGKLIGRSLREFVTVEGFEAIKRQTKVRKAGKESTYEMEIIRSDGERKIIIVTATPMFNVEGHELKGVLGVFRDVTRMKKMEEELTRAEKLDSIGILAGGIAHDFNNILTAILGNLSLSKMDMRPEDEAYGRLGDAEKAAIRARDLTQQLLTFSKGGAPIKKAASIIEIIRDSADFVLRGSNVRAEFAFPDKLPAAVVDPGQISQVINNLVINANQAMPNGGIITITAEETLVTRDINLPIEPGSYIKLIISDQGIGIKKEHLPRIFDPYFTTKAAGSGLGLATTYSIIRRHDGHIEVESEPGKGTRFIIYLPSSREVSREVGINERIPFSGKGKILVMDDEASILKVTSAALRKLGFESDLAKDGQSAVEYYMRAMKQEKPYTAIIMDLTVPGGMGGARALELITEIDPEVCAIVTSGYSNDPVLANFKKYGFKGYIMKPFKVNDLANTLQEVLESA